MDSSLAEALIGAFVGAVVGSVLGYLSSYHLSRRARVEEVEERRKRLMRTLAHEIDLEVKPLAWNPKGTVSTGTHLSALEPLLDLVAALDDEPFLRALTHLKSRTDSFNDLIGVTNSFVLTSGDETRVAAGMIEVESRYQQVQGAAAMVKPYLEIRR